MDSPAFDAEGFVLAGGESSRMGADKALAQFQGRPLVQNALCLLQAAGLTSARIAGSRSPLDRYAETIRDLHPNCGPLAGIHAALSASASPLNVFLPVDMPLLPASLIVCLLTRARLTGAPVTCVRVNGRIEPFPVVLSRSSLPHIELRLVSRQLGCLAAWHAVAELAHEPVDSIHVEYLVAAGQCAHPAGFPPLWWFQSANTPGQLAWLNAIAGGISRAGKQQSGSARVI